MAAVLTGGDGAMLSVSVSGEAGGEDGTRSDRCAIGSIEMDMLRCKSAQLRAYTKEIQ
jgi:hypothetical protein